jgi:hypothetical protein
MSFNPCIIAILDDIEEDFKTVYLVDKNSKQALSVCFDLWEKLWEYVKTVAIMCDLTLDDIVFEDNYEDLFGNHSWYTH